MHALSKVLAIASAETRFSIRKHIFVVLTKYFVGCESVVWAIGRGKSFGKGDGKGAP
jgi:hypothetical protein